MAERILEDEPALGAALWGLDGAPAGEEARRSRVGLAQDVDGSGRTRSADAVRALEES